MQLEWVRAFLAVVDHGGFTAAAVQLYRSQGRVSSYIASLEAALSAQLLDRSSRPVRLTPVGEAFVPHARAMLHDLEAGKDSIAAVQGLVRGGVTLATYPSAGASFVPKVLVRLAEIHPGIQVDLLEGATHGIDEALDAGKALLAIRPTLPPPRSADRLKQALLWRERMCLVVPEGHPLTTRAQVAVADLAGQELAVSGQQMHDDVEAVRLLSREGVEPNLRFLTDQPQILIGLVRAGLAVGLLNELSLQTVRTDGVEVLHVSPGLYRDVAVYWTPGLGGSPAASALLRAVVSSPVPQSTTDLRGQDGASSPAEHCG